MIIKSLLRWPDDIDSSSASGSGCSMRALQWFVDVCGRYHTIILPTATKSSRSLVKVVLGKWYTLSTTRTASAWPWKWSAMKNGFTDKRRKKSASSINCAGSTQTIRLMSFTCTNISRLEVTSASRSSCCRWISMSSSKRTSFRASVSDWSASSRTRCSSVWCCSTIIISFTVIWSQKMCCSRRLAAAESRYTLPCTPLLHGGRPKKLRSLDIAHIWQNSWTICMIYVLTEINKTGTLLSRRLRQRKRLHATDVSICSYVCMSVCLFVCLSPNSKNAIFSKTKQFRAMVSIDDIGSRTQAFQRTYYWTPKIQDGGDLPSRILMPKCKNMIFSKTKHFRAMVLIDDL